jgi:hypothetical protein
MSGLGWSLIAVGLRCLFGQPEPRVSHPQHIALSFGLDVS